MANAGQYRCVVDARGIKQYRLEGRRVAANSIPPGVLSGVACGRPAKTSPPKVPKAKKLVEEEQVSEEEVVPMEAEEFPPPRQYRRKPPPAMVGGTRGGREIKPASPTSGLKTSPRRVSVAGQEVKPRSPPGKPAVGRGGLAKCPKNRPQDYDFLRFYYEQTKRDDPSRNRRLIERFRREYQQDYPYSDEEEVTA